MRVKDAVGRYGEQRAVEHLQDSGLEILDRNWRCRDGELDIVARDEGDVLVFCEVKTRSGVRFGDPAEAVGTDKILRVRRLAVQWLRVHECSRRGMRFDVVTVLRGRDGVLIRHLRGAF
jgi:putative endonuclease